MKRNIIIAILSLLTFHSSLLTLHAAVPLRWTVETSRAVPAQFEAYQGETLALEAALQSYGKPLEAPLNYSLDWQTNGMGNAYWSTNCNHSIEQSEQSNNVLRATWTPSMETGAKVYNCFIGKPGTIYHAAFQLRLRPSPGATPNELPLPQKVIDFAKVTVLNPPWSGGGGGGGVDTNAVRDIVRDTLATNGIRSVDGAARPLPKYLHLYNADDSYPEAAAEYYRSRGNGKTDGGCSSVRDGGFLYRNFDYPFDDRAEFVVRMSPGKDRFASVGVAQVGTNLTEQIVTSGKWSKWYKALPGATVDGINENGVVAEINVVDTPVTGWHTNATDNSLHPLAAVRWILDNATNAQHAAEYIAANIRFPQGWMQNFHYMVADETSTYIVENGTAYQGGSGVSPLVLTNFRLYPTRDTTGEGQERYDALASGENITNAWYTNAYRRETNPPWVSDLAEVIAYTNEIFDAWAAHPKEYFRGQLNGGKPWWQSIHTSIYDITNRALRVAVQEVDDWYVFAVPSAGGVKPEAVRDIVQPMIGAATNAMDKTKRDKDDLEVYEKVGVGNDWVWASKDKELEGLLNDRQGHGVGVSANYDYGRFKWLVSYDFADDWIPEDPYVDGSSNDVSVVFRFMKMPDFMPTVECTATRAHEFRPVSPADRLATKNGVNAAIAAADPLKQFSDYEGHCIYWDDGVLKTGAFTDFELGSYLKIYNWYLLKLISGQALPTYLASGEWDTNTGTNRFARIGDIPPQPSTTTLRLYDETRDCYWIGKMVNGVLNWEVE